MTTKTKTKPVKGRVLTPTEIEKAEALSKALVEKLGLQMALNNARQNIGRLTREINQFGFSRATVVWAEARTLAGLPQAPTYSELVRR